MRAQNMIRMGVATLAARLTGASIPLNVMISVTNRCPARCRYCNIPNRVQREMSTDELVRLFDELRSLGTQRIALWGGEPLVREDVGYLVDYAKKKCKFFTSLDTNGYLVPAKIDALANLDVLVVSFDGPQEVHDRNREPGSYQKMIEALQAACGRLRVFTITVLTKENTGHIDHILQTAKHMGFSATFQLPHHNKDLASESEGAMLPENSEYRRAIELILRRKREGYPIVSSVPYLEYLLRWRDYRQYTSRERKGLNCWAGKLYCNVDTDGSVYPCSGTVGTMPAKNFLEVGFREAFASMRQIDCQSCIASCFTEYNFMHDLHAGVIWNWIQYTRGRQAR